ncbi:MULTISPECIES: DUF2161 domain-containing phosphodiesterase [unclassified Roseovarius]|uniref:DUF2161 domain-containing phosphodiesterase n=1 Tax=unclassified Roseovarius TaxID=2614913 RepID=UPI00273FD161|nr:MULTISPECIES: DUF2161 family putative PD-(D/E)XK-type phosphodiesterase [unclassified Roseovarius]
MSDAPEEALYAPVKAFLEGQGYVVKGEIGAVDVMAVRGEDPPVLVELKNRFTLSLVHQGIARQAVSDAVYLAVPHKTGRRAYVAMRDNAALCRRLGLGLMTVRQRDGFVDVMVDPGPYKPRKSKAHLGRLLREFQRRVGDPTKGGSTRTGLVTAYRQDVLRVATYLADHGASKGAVVAKATGVGNATRIMADDHYGWFERVSTGIYALTPAGADGLTLYGRVDAMTERKADLP